MDHESTTREWKLFGLTALVLLALTVAGVATAVSVVSDAVDTCVVDNAGSAPIIDPQHPRPCDDRAVSLAQQDPQGPTAATIWAVVGPKPSGGGAFEVKNASHATGVSVDDKNIFTVSFDQDVSRCVYQVTPRSALGLVTHIVEAQPAEQAPNQIMVRLTEGTTGNPTRVPFQVTVTC